MKRFKFTFLASTFAVLSVSAFAQNDAKTLQYIEKYKQLAIKEQWRTGVPASIKLAQGILETASGNSELSQNANNHFGIKCKATWTGDTYTYTDDRKDECFRKYNDDHSSYLDHSDFLVKNPRYSTLFTYAVDDYKNWAHGLKKAGYATSPTYAQKLIGLIEKYELNQYTLIAMNSMELPIEEKVYAVANSNSTTDVPYKYTAQVDKDEAPASITKVVTQEQVAQPSQEYYITTKLNNLKGFYAPKGAMLLDYAIKNKFRYSRLLEYNELPDAPLDADMFIYLERKHAKSPELEDVVVGENETVSQISQRTGVQLATIRQLNKLVVGVEPKTGSVLNLKQEATQAPEVYIPSPNKVAKVSNINKSNNSTDAYVVNKKYVPETPNEESVAIVPENKVTEEIKTVTEVKESTPKTELPTRSKVVEAPISKKPVKEVAEAPKKEIQAVVEDDKNLTPYERLKRHMDKQVDKKDESYYESTAAQTVPTTTSDEDYVTVPSRDARPSQATSTTQQQTSKPATTVKKTTKPAAPKYHTVKRGETLTSIASKYKVTVKELQAWNKVSPKTLQAGEKIKVSK